MVPDVPQRAKTQPFTAHMAADMKDPPIPPPLAGGNMKEVMSVV